MRDDCIQRLIIMTDDDDEDDNDDDDDDDLDDYDDSLKCSTFCEG